MSIFLPKIKSRRAFTLVEIMIVVAIIALLAAIAIPNFVQSRKEARYRACVSNMRVIDGAIQQYLMAPDNNLTENDYGTVTFAKLEADGYLVTGTEEKVLCGAGKGLRYTITSEGVDCPATGTDDHGTYKNGIWNKPTE